MSVFCPKECFTNRNFRNIGMYEYKLNYENRLHVFIIGQELYFKICGRLKIINIVWCFTTFSKLRLIIKIYPISVIWVCMNQENRLHMSIILYTIYFKRYGRLQIINILWFYYIFKFTPYHLYWLDFRNMGMYEYILNYDNYVYVYRIFYKLYLKIWTFKDYQYCVILLHFESYVLSLTLTKFLKYGYVWISTNQENHTCLEYSMRSISKDMDVYRLSIFCDFTIFSNLHLIINIDSISEICKYEYLLNRKNRLHVSRIF